MKKIILVLLMLILNITFVSAKTNQFNIELGNLKTNTSNTSDSAIISLSKKVTYLLLGKSNSETGEEYYKRYHEYLELRYNPVVPKDETSLSGLDENSEEYKDDLLSGMSIPGMFNILNELEVDYDNISSIRIFNRDNAIISKVILENVEINKQNEKDPLTYDRVKRDLILYYYFKPINNEDKLYYVMAETKNELDNYFQNIEELESSEISIHINHNSYLNELYDFSSIETLSNQAITNVYSKNIDSVVYINSFYNNNITSSCNGFFVKKGLILTTWSFLKQALVSSQYITIIDNNKKVYKLSGIAKYDENSDLALLKLEEEIGIPLNIKEKTQVADAVLTLSSKTGVGFSIQGGIVLTSDKFIQTSIPLLNVDQGSPLLNTEGEVIGINTDKDVNNSTSLSINAETINLFLKDIIEANYSDIKANSFEETKNTFYKKIVIGQEESMLSKSKWESLIKEFDIENNIFLPILKASSDGDVISLRYQNDAVNYFSGMELASKFRSFLENNNYKNTLDSLTKCIYENNHYSIIIMENFNYLIITVVKK